jgi:uncharacterized membrane protein
MRSNAGCPRLAYTCQLGIAFAVLPFCYAVLVTLRKYLVLLAIVLFGSSGDTLLSRGMKDIGEVHLSHWTHVITAVFNPWIACGIVCLMVFFGSYLASLSWADLTYVLPATAFGYVVLALLSKFFLHEQISLARWAGIVLITAGVGFVAGGPSLTERTEGQEIAQLVGSSEDQA